MTESAAEQAQLIHESNEIRVKDLEAKSGGQASLENAFDALKILVHLEHISTHLGIADEVALDFEGRRAAMLSEIESTYAKMLAAREEAQRLAILSGGGQAQPGPRIVRQGK